MGLQNQERQNMKQFLVSLMFTTVAFVLLSSAAPNGAPPPREVAERIIDSVASEIVAYASAWSAGTTP
jgi:hypothetical protein